MSIAHVGRSAWVSRLSCEGLVSVGILRVMKMGYLHCDWKLGIKDREIAMEVEAGRKPSESDVLFFPLIGSA